MRKLQDRVAVVTGAAHGIGKATALLLARKGCHLVLADINREGLEETRREVEQLGRKASAFPTDVSDLAAVNALRAEVERLHGVAHILVNNAGVSVAARFEDQSLEDFAWLMGVNFWGVVYGCKVFLPLLRQAEEAHIVNISSVFGLVGVPFNSSYCSSKFAVRGLSECLRAELIDTRIGVTSVHPGGIATNIVKSGRYVEPKDMPGLRDKTVKAFERMMRPEKAAESIVRGIQRNSARVLITREAYAVDAAKRVFPDLTTELVAKHWTKILGVS